MTAATHERPRRRDRRGSYRTTGSLAPAMAPMIDVVFLLLMYFILAADFSTREEIYRLDLPELVGAEPESDRARLDPFRLDQDPLRIAVRTTGPRPDDIAIAMVEPYPTAPDLAALEGFLRRASITGDLGLFAPDHPVLIEPDASTAWEHAVAVFDAAVKTGYTNVIFVRLP